MDDEQILRQINELVDEEHRLRERRQSGDMDADDERARLRHLEEALDQCWDLLRQRRARREFGQDVAEAAPRPVEQVERYLG